MTGNTENLVLEILKEIQLRLSRIEAEMHELKNRATGIEVVLTALGQQVGGLTTAVYSEPDRIDSLERRLELRDTD